MRLADRYHVIRASLVLLLIPLLAAVDACGDVPIGSDAGGAGGTGSVSSTNSANSTSSTSSTGGALPCQPGKVVPCSSGPAGTQGVGICKAGLQAWNPDGMAYG